MKRRHELTVIAIFIVIVMAIGVVFLVRHGNSTKPVTMDTMSSKSVETDTVAITNYMFSPMSIRIKAGTKVTWTNKDSVQHTVDADDKAKVDIDSPKLAQGQSFSFTFKKAGTYTYHCDVHPSMHGTVVVTD